MNSCFYECHMTHARFAPQSHRFAYRMFLFAIDLDELPKVHRRLGLFSFNRPNLYSFRDGDYLPLDEAARVGIQTETVAPGRLSKSESSLTQGSEAWISSTAASCW